MSDATSGSDIPQYEWYPTGCVLCGHVSKTPEGHEGHMEEVHDC